MQLTTKDIYFLAHTDCHNFYDEQKERFEIYHVSDNLIHSKNDFISDKQNRMLWFDNKLDALLSFKSLNKLHSCAIFLDLMQCEWGIITDKIFIELAE